VIEFTILLDDSDLQFEPLRTEPDLAFILPPTARIGHGDDVVHLAPIPVHCFFNAITFGHWLMSEHGLSENDAFVVYAIHDMFKALLCWTSDRKWHHSRDEFFLPIERALHNTGIFDDFAKSFQVVKEHHSHSVTWTEATLQESSILARHWARGWGLIGLTVRLQSALSNVLSIAYVKRLFVEAYVEAMRSEFPDVFARFDAVSYKYEFVDPAALTSDADQDIETLCCQSEVNLEDNGRRLVIRSFIGASGSHWSPDTKTKVQLPFWLLLTLREDPISILFPVPVRYADPTGNHDFYERVRDGFHDRVRDLLESVPVSKSKRDDWSKQVDDILSHLDDTFHLIHTHEFDQAVEARDVDKNVVTEECALCGSLISPEFACSPIADLGWSSGRYTDWHIGDAEQACMLCAISNFKTPPVLQPAKQLVFQRKVVYCATSTPGAIEANLQAADLSFFSAPIMPKLDITSLESLVTLNVVAALYLYDTLRQTICYRDAERDLWLQSGLDTDPFTFIGEVAVAHSKFQMPSFLAQLHRGLSRKITLLDPLIPMRVEVPFHALVCVWGTSKGRHFELKYKPLVVSNETASLPIIWEGYHLLDKGMLEAIQRLQAFVESFGSHRVSHRMKLTALAESPQEFVATMTELGGYGYATILERLDQLSKGKEPLKYLSYLRNLLRQTPLIYELWG
jgi:hypothetical protein